MTKAVLPAIKEESSGREQEAHSSEGSTDDAIGRLQSTQRRVRAESIDHHTGK